MRELQVYEERFDPEGAIVLQHVRQRFNLPADHGNEMDHS
jgi:hypothetical protein